MMKSYTAIRLYGPGHVVAHNYVADFHDGIDTEMYGMPDGSHPIDGPTYPPREFWDRRPTAIDIYNNYITNAHDNSIEMDGSMHNIRVMRNMLINSASHPMSTQPSTGGPIYFIRNIAYHAPGGSTRLTAGSPGVFFYNNTILTETNGGASANVHWRNNLMLGQNAQAAIFSVNTNTNYSSSDYNGFRPNPGTESFQWNSPPSSVPMILADGSGSAKLETRKFATLEAYAQATKQDQHSVLVDYDIFMKVTKLDAKDLATVQRLYKAEGLRLQAQAGIGGRRSRHRAAERHRWLHRPGARSRRARGRPAGAGLRTETSLARLLRVPSPVIGPLCRPSLGSGRCQDRLRFRTGILDAGISGAFGMDRASGQRAPRNRNSRL